MWERLLRGAERDDPLYPVQQLAAEYTLASKNPDDTVLEDLLEVCETPRGSGRAEGARLMLGALALAELGEREQVRRLERATHLSPNDQAFLGALNLHSWTKKNLPEWLGFDDRLFNRLRADLRGRGLLDQRDPTNEGKNYLLVLTDKGRQALTQHNGG